LAEATIQAKRYAQAAFLIALEQKTVERWLSDLGKIVALTHVQELVDTINNPAVSLEAKRRLLDSQIKNYEPMTVNLVHLLVARGKFKLINGIYESFRQLVDALQGVDKAEVTTAIPLENDERQKIIDYLGKVSGKKIVITEKVDAAIIGGIIARVGGKIIDGSTSSKLTALGNTLAETAR